jgi:hypothetical protein
MASKILSADVSGVTNFPGRAISESKVENGRLTRWLTLFSDRELAMDRQNPVVGGGGTDVSPQAFATAMADATQQMLREVMEAVNRAPDGAWINGSEMQVRDLMGEYRRRVFETALQMKVDAAEGAFSPGGAGPVVVAFAAEQGDEPTQHADGQRPREPASAAMAGSHRRRGRQERRRDGAGRRTAGRGRGNGVAGDAPAVL